MESEGFTAVLMGPVVFVMSPWNRENSAYGVSGWAILLGQEFDMLSEGIRAVYGINGLRILYLRFKERTLAAMLELGDPNRESS